MHPTKRVGWVRQLPRVWNHLLPLLLLSRLRQLIHEAWKTQLPRLRLHPRCLHPQRLHPLPPLRPQLLQVRHRVQQSPLLKDLLQDRVDRQWLLKQPCELTCHHPFQERRFPSTHLGMHLLVRLLRDLGYVAVVGVPLQLARHPRACQQTSRPDRKLTGPQWLPGRRHHTLSRSGLAFPHLGDS